MKGPAKADSMLGGGSRKAGRALFALSLFALFSLAGFVALVPSINLPPVRSLKASPSVRLLDIGDSRGLDSIGIEELSDFAPLFIPTKWNYAAELPLLPVPEVFPGGFAGLEGDGKTSVFYGARDRSDFGAGENDIERGKLGFTNSVMRGSFSGFGRADLKPQSPEEGINYEIVDMRSGRVFKSGFIPSKNRVFSKAEFTAVVTPDSRVTTPVIVETSGEGASDAALAKSVPLILKRADSGYYKVVFYP